MNMNTGMNTGMQTELGYANAMNPSHPSLTPEETKAMVQDWYNKMHKAIDKGTANVFGDGNSISTYAERRNADPVEVYFDKKYQQSTQSTAMTQQETPVVQQVQQEAPIASQSSIEAPQEVLEETYTDVLPTPETRSEALTGALSGIDSGNDEVNTEDTNTGALSGATKKYGTENGAPGFTGEQLLSNPYLSDNAQEEFNMNMEAQALRNQEKEQDLKAVQQAGNEVKTSTKSNSGWDAFSFSSMADTITENSGGFLDAIGNFFGNEQVQRALLVGGVQLAAGAIAGESGRNQALLALEGAVKGFMRNPRKEQAMAMIDKYGEFILPEDRGAVMEAINTGNFEVVLNAGLKGMTHKDDKMAIHKSSDGNEYETKNGVIVDKTGDGKITKEDALFTTAPTKVITKDTTFEGGTIGAGSTVELDAAGNIARVKEFVAPSVGETADANWRMTGSADTGYFMYNQQSGEIKPIPAAQQAKLGVKTGEGLNRPSAAGIEIKEIARNNALRDKDGKVIADENGLTQWDYNNKNFTDTFGEEGVKAQAKGFEGQIQQIIKSVAEGKLGVNTGVNLFDISDDAILAKLTPEQADQFLAVREIRNKYVQILKQANKGQGDYTDSDARIDAESLGLDPMAPPKTLASAIDRAVARIDYAEGRIDSETYAKRINSINRRFRVAKVLGTKASVVKTHPTAGKVTRINGKFYRVDDAGIVLGEVKL